MTDDDQRPLAPIISIACFHARRPKGGPRPAPDRVDQSLLLIPQLPILSDVGVVRAPGGPVLVSGIGADLDPDNRVQPAYTPGQARLLAERFLAAARAAECASCCSEVYEEVISAPRSVCANCELIAAGE